MAEDTWSPVRPDEVCGGCHYSRGILLDALIEFEGSAMILAMDTHAVVLRRAVLLRRVRRLGERWNTARRAEATEERWGAADGDLN